ncbi:MAG TPA: S41 family peptidase [Bryobacteraceae bacterium]|nr:S41 family peptidase [Bryobacteraceae bacterium]
MAHHKRSWLVLLLIVFLCSFLGGIVGSQVEAAASAPDTTPLAEISLDRDVNSFARLYALVEQNFATAVDPNKAVYRGAIPGMLRELDPHSNFFDPKDFQVLKEDQNGHYSGVGMQVGSRGSKTVIIAPFPGSPAYRAGLRPGDAIVAVNDKSTEGLNTNEVADLLKGPRNTPVKIAVRREGAADYLTFNVIREDISRKTVQDGFWVKPGIAYIHILSFGDYTFRELEQNLRRLGENNIQGLVLDLRENPGGLLDQAVDVADHFLQKGQTIVSQRGRASAEKVYRASRGNQGRDYPIVVLVNRYSASASEIVSGALQDHDRAWVLGETTFGKGLVQTLYPLADHTGLALTTAHFYTPSGRLIQRDYSHTSFYDYYFDKDRNARNPNDVKMTDGGRTVYGGGGITPDQKYQTPKMDNLESDLFRNGLFSFTRVYFAQHPTALPKGWMPGNDVLEALHDYELNHGVKFTEAQFTADHDWIRRHLAKEMYIWAFNVDESDRVFAMTDPEVQMAIDAMSQAAALAQHAKRAMVQRMR